MTNVCRIVALLKDKPEEEQLAHIVAYKLIKDNNRKYQVRRIVGLLGYEHIPMELAISALEWLRANDFIYYSDRVPNNVGILREYTDSPYIKPDTREYLESFKLNEKDNQRYKEQVLGQWTSAVDCNECKHLTMTESEQRRYKSNHTNHMCRKHGCLVFHHIEGHCVSKDHDARLHPCIMCDGESFERRGI